MRRAGERKDGLVDVTQARVWLARAILPINAKASEAERLEAAAVVSRDTQDVANCDAMTALNDGYGSGAVSRLDDMLVADMAPQMQQLISKLEPESRRAACLCRRHRITNVVQTSGTKA